MLSCFFLHTIKQGGGRMISLSVRDLAQFVHASGDLGSINTDYERAWIGSQIHRDIQSKYASNEREVFLKRSDTIDDITFCIEGRCDLLYQKDDQYYLEEIKTTALPLDKITKEKIHEAQMLLYGAMFLSQKEIDTMTLCLHYVHIISKEDVIFEDTYTKEQLEAFYLNTLQQYVYWARKKENLHVRAISQAKQLKFPYQEYRPTQKQLCAAVYRSIEAKEPLFLQAATGIGKTISTLFPALKCIGNDTIDKIFYLCAKNITAKTAIDTMRTIQQQATFQTIHINAKDKMCLLEKRNCDSDECPYAKGYYQHNKQAMDELLEYTLITKAEIQLIAKKHQVCPFELSLDTLLYCDVIICDYNYAFDPKVYLKRCFEEKSRSTLLVDECHNLVDRSLSMYSVSLQQSQVKAMLQLPCDDAYVLKALHTLVDKMNDYYDEEDEYSAYEDNQESIIEACLSLQNTLQVYLRKDEKIDDAWKDFYFMICDYLRIVDYYDEHYCFLVHSHQQEVTMKQYCMNASNALNRIYRLVHNVIFFSATLSPLHYYQTMLGGKKEAKAYDFPSIFPRENILPIVHRHIKTLYKVRDDSLYDVVESIYASIMGKKGNYIVFAPSYTYLQAIYELFITLHPQFDTMVQTSDQREEDKQAFLNAFQQKNHHFVGFAILGGMFSEGIDYIGEQLIGCIIVSVGMGTPTKEKELMKAHFDALHLDGFAYAYRYPGLNKVLQAAGRLIRSASDYGILVFLDDRFASNFYQSLMPQAYHCQHYVSFAHEILPLVTSFFQNKEANSFKSDTTLD